MRADWLPGLQLESHHTDRPFRPVQYLGNKLRVLDRIVDSAQGLIGDSGRVADLFSGTSVVAQGLARRGFEVTAVDTQHYAGVFSRATLAIGRRATEQIPVGSVINFELPEGIEETFRSWRPCATAEGEVLTTGNYETIQQFYQELPLIWRRSDHSHGDEIVRGGDTALGVLPLITSIYAGSYFGVKQALLLDKLRLATEMLRARGEIGRWQHDALLTAIMSAASAAAHSAGKHFAQPLNAGSSSNETFLLKRLLEDRRVCILGYFQEAVLALETKARSQDEGHRVYVAPAEEFVLRNGEPFDLFYLDPPYTAQQYSRFYHLLETLVHYRFPSLLHAGKLTSGLYPQDRYKSAFSSKSRALKSLETIMAAARQSRTSVLISYSISANESRGNARMITLDQLLHLCESSFGARAVECHHHGHRYRQFNSSANSNEARNDSEILISCKIL